MARYQQSSSSQTYLVPAGVVHGGAVDHWMKEHALHRFIRGDKAELCCASILLAIGVGR